VCDWSAATVNDHSSIVTASAQVIEGFGEIGFRDVDTYTTLLLTFAPSLPFDCSDRI
jgi:hypothetical protein